MMKRSYLEEGGPWKRHSQLSYNTAATSEEWGENNNGKLYIVV